MQVNNINKGFNNEFGFLQYNQIDNFITDMRNKTGWSLATFYNKKSGRTRVTKLEQPIIRQVFRKYGIEV